MVVFATILLLLFPSKSISIEIPEIFLALGWTRINLVHSENTELFRFIKTFSEYDIAVKWYKHGFIQDDIPTVVITNSDFELANEIISERKSESSKLFQIQLTCL